MKVDSRNERVILSSGKTFFAHHGMLGFNDDFGNFGMGGCDGELQPPEPFTHEEAVEIVAHMVEQWNAWAGEIKAR